MGQKTNVQYRRASPYYDTPKQAWYLGHYKKRPIPRDGSDTLITLDSKYQYRPHALSFDLYGTDTYWWVFMVTNMDKIKDPIFDMVPGLEIYVPSHEKLLKYIGA